MKFGFYGNPGNYPFMLARALRALGHDVAFIVSGEAALDRPENRYSDVGPPYPDWIHDLSPAWRTYFPTEWRRRAVEILRGCDYAMLSHTGPSLAAEVGVPAVSLLTGSDVLHLANPASVEAMRLAAAAQPEWLALPDKLATFAELVARQREGIGASRLVTHFTRGLLPEGDRILDGIGVPDARRMMLLMSDTERVASAPPPANPRVRAFCAARLNWKRPLPDGMTELDFKGTDVMIRGLGQFVRAHGPVLDVRLVRKGVHVAETAALAQAQGIAGQVTWLDEMSQEAVLKEFRAADLVFDQLGQSVVAMAGLDAMATGRPLIANARPEHPDPAIDAPSPVCQARTPGEVAAHLEALVFDAAKRAQVGDASRRYVERFFSAREAARRLLARLGDQAAGPDSVRGSTFSTR